MIKPLLLSQMSLPLAVQLRMYEAESPDISAASRIVRYSVWVLIDCMAASSGKTRASRNCTWNKIGFRDAHISEVLLRNDLVDRRFETE